MTPCLETIFALRLATGRKLTLIAMIHRARNGWFRGNAVTLAADAQMNKSNTVHTFKALEAAGLIYPGPDNEKHARPRSWRIDPKIIIEYEDMPRETTRHGHRVEVSALHSDR